MAKGCVWSTGKMNQPDHAFCSVIDVTLDPQPFLTCPTKSQTECNGPCKWYTGSAAPPAGGCPTKFAGIPPPDCTSVTAAGATAATTVPSYW